MPDPIRRIAAKKAAALLNRPLAARRMRHVLTTSEPPYKVQVGCGRVRLQGWLATDIGHHAELYLDATKPWPFPPGSVTHVYADNVIEHLTLSAGRRLLRQAYEAMAPGGWIRVSTPDVERTARIYLEGGALAERCMSENRDVFGYEVHHPVDLLRNTFAEHGHHRGFLYDLSSLRAELEVAGFRDVARQEAGSSQEPALRGLELRTSDTAAARALIVEARKH